MQELRGLEGHLKLTFDPVQKINTQYIGYRGQYSFKESIIVPGCLKKFSNSTQLSKVLFFIAKNFTGSIDRKDWGLDGNRL